MKHFERDGLTLSYEDEGTGPVVVFQHGLGGDASQPASQAPPGHRVVTLECRGHGLSELGPEADLGFGTFADDLDALLDDLGIDSALFAGISMGAGVVLSLAQTNPSRVDGLVLIRPAWRDKPRPANLMVFEEIAAYIRDFGTAKGKRLFADRSRLLRSISGVSRAAQRSLLAQFDRPGALSNVDVLEHMVNDQPVVGGRGDELESVKVPALIIRTRDDPAHPAAHALWLSKRLSQTQLLMAPRRDLDAAHRAAIAHSISDFHKRIGQSDRFPDAAASLERLSHQP